MTHEHLTRLQRANAFNPTPRHDDLYALHVPFDELTNSATCESRSSEPSDTGTESPSSARQALANPPSRSTFSGHSSKVWRR